MSSDSDRDKKLIAEGYLAAVEYMQGWIGRANFIDVETFKNRLAIMRRFGLEGFPFNKGFGPDYKRELRKRQSSE